MISLLGCAVWATGVDGKAKANHYYDGLCIKLENFVMSLWLGSQEHLMIHTDIY